MLVMASDQHLQRLLLRLLQPQLQQQAYHVDRGLDRLVILTQLLSTSIQLRSPWNETKMRSGSRRSAARCRTGRWRTWPSPWRASSRRAAPSSITTWWVT